jgi:hypothetical protein
MTVPPGLASARSFVYPAAPASLVKGDGRASLCQTTPILRASTPLGDRR